MPDRFLTNEKPAISIYLMGMSDHPDLLEKTRETQSRQRLPLCQETEDVDLKILEKLIVHTVNYVKRKVSGE